MTTTTMRSRASRPARLEPASTFDLQTALAAFEKMTNSVNVFANRAVDREVIWRFVLPWVPLAERRRSEAACSPTDHARWQEIVSGVRRPPQGESDSDVGTLAHAVSRLLHALAAAAQPGPSVAEIVERTRQSVATGAYPPGRLLTLKRVAADAHCPAACLDRVRLAVRDLEADGLITLSPSNQVRIAARDEATDRPEEIAAWLRTLIQAGVYPPGSALPTRPALCRAMVSPQSSVAGALALLHDRGVVHNRAGVRTAVRAVLPFDVTPPPDLTSLLPRLKESALPETDLSHTGIRETCFRSHTWWRSRLTPHPETLRHTTRALTAAAAYLLPLVTSWHPDDADLHATARRTAVTALADEPSGSDASLWRVACLGASVLETLLLAGDAL
ncbi:GntR family transcriptional regulator [Streptomyces sp. NPDC055992]|uniref:GntR family transcriptional regulator n=1 Tax=Streptomyces sp. NPDC055992 TaxID=3345673 RepID=UPI0035D52E65